MNGKKVRREGDWPSPEEIDREIIERLYKGKPPAENWQPSRNVAHAMAMADMIIRDRSFNFEIKYDRTVLKGWECRIFWNNYSEMRRVMENRQYQRFNDPDVTEHYWAEGKSAELTICYTVLNMLDRVTEHDYFVDARGEEES